MNYLEKQKRILAIHDISCVGRCSLTVALPILCSAGFDTSVLPTAVLSTHTGEFKNYTYRDLTDDIVPITNHWKELGLEFDALYTGYLGSYKQIDLIADVFEKFKLNSNIIMVDPVMGDNGRLYSAYTHEMAKGMKKLCEKCDILVPNLTEAAFILGEEFKGGCHDAPYIESILNKLSQTGAKIIVLTGVSFEEQKIGAAGLDSSTGKIHYSFCGRIPGHFHGTGDIFASVLLAALMKGRKIDDAIKTSVGFTHKCIAFSEELQQEKRYGVCFEKALPFLAEMQNDIERA